jgi:hypothetical protein
MRIAVLLTALAVSLACGSASAPATKSSPLARAFIVLGDSQQATAGAALSVPIVVEALDSNGQAAVGLSVIFGPSGNGNATPSSTTTDSTGQARTVWTLSTSPGPDTMLFAVTQPNSNDVVQDTVFATGTP